jgi:hypothetical protein
MAQTMEDAAAAEPHDGLDAELLETAARYRRVVEVERDRDVFKRTAEEQLAVASRLAQEATQTRDAVRRIKSLVCGEKNPRWSDEWATTNTRAAIADLCDSVLTERATT